MLFSAQISAGIIRKGLSSDDPSLHQHGQKHEAQSYSQYCEAHRCLENQEGGSLTHDEQCSPELVIHEDRRWESSIATRLVN
ncbi:MAG: hypothetical protein AAF403_02625 [Pseudomonadota bacterium]